MVENGEREVHTGIARLDEDLQVLFDFCGGAKLETFRNAVADRAISEERLSGLVPQAVVNLTLLVTAGDFEAVSLKASEAGRHALQRAKALVEENFSQLWAHPTGRRVLLEAAPKAAKRPGPNPLADSLHIISSITSLHLYAGTPPELIPLVRVALESQAGALLLDTMMDWNDLSYVASRLLSLLARSMEQARTLADSGQLDIAAIKTKVQTRLEEAQESLGQIKRLAPHYGIKLQMDDVPARDNSEAQPRPEDLQPGPKGKHAI